jgi:hypothetical protein
MFDQISTRKHNETAMEHIHKSMYKFAATLATIALLAGPASGALMFWQSGDDLLVANDTVIRWTPGVNGSKTAFWGLSFETAYTTPNPERVFINPGGGMELSLGGSTTSGTLNWGVRTVDILQSSSRSFSMSFAGGPNSITALDEIELSIGTATISNWFSSGGRLPDNSGAALVYLLDTAVGGQRFGAPGNVVISVVPEPSSIVLLGLAALFFVARCDNITGSRPRRCI